jgi:DNA processing protein
MTIRSLSDAERLEWLRLIRSENVGPITFHRLLDRFGTAGAALAALPELAQRGGKKSALRIHSKAEAKRELDALAKLGGRMIAACEPDYPRALAAIEDAPPMLSVLGHAHLLQQPSIGIVGARNASVNGRRMARDIAAALGQRGYVIVSGLARGIDAAAHEGALTSGTIAAVAGGLDVVYPPENTGLFNSIIEQGCVAAESALGTQPQAGHFPRRNRIVSGLTLGTLVIEAARRSGSLITARLALEQGREVFAVPGSPLDPRALGTNNLIRQGAHLVETADDVDVVLHALREQRLREPAQTAFVRPQGATMAVEIPADAHHRVLTALSPSPTPVDEVVRDCQLSASVVQVVLTDLDLAGRILRLPGNRVCLI